MALSPSFGAIGGSYTVQDGVDLVPSVPQPIFKILNPRCIVRIDGVQYSPISVSTESNAHGATNTATIVLPISGKSADGFPNGDFSVTLFKGTDSSGARGADSTIFNQNITLGQATKLADAAANFQPVYVEIYGDNVTEELNPDKLIPDMLQPLFYGLLDVYKPTFHEDKIEFSARSLAAPMADTKVTGVSMNQTITSFMAEQATKLGIPFVFNLGPNFKPVTIQEVLGKELIGGSQSNIQNALEGKSVWELIKNGSIFDDTDFWEDSTTGVLHYESPGLVDRNDVNFIYNSNIATASGEHAITESKKVQVDVRTYTRRNMVSTTTRVDPKGKVTSRTRVTTSSIIPGTAGSISSSVSTGPKGTSYSGSVNYGTGGAYHSKPTQAKTQYTGTDVYTFYFPGLSPGRVNSLARGLWRQISMHEFHATLGAQMIPYFAKNLRITSKLHLSNFGYQGWNTTFYPRRISMMYSISEGWKFTVESVTNPGPPGEV